MSSAISAYSQIQNGNRLYINITGVQSTIYDSTGAKAPWVNGVGALSTAGSAIFRDMGKTVYIPSPTVGNVVGAQSSILRKVQLVPSGTAGFYGTGDSTAAESNTDAPTSFYTGYILLGGQTYGGGTGTATGVARLG